MWLSRMSFGVEWLSFGECTSFVQLNVVLMCKLFLPSKAVKTSWISRNPVGKLETVPFPEELLSMWGNTGAIQHHLWVFWRLQAVKCRRWVGRSHLKTGAITLSRTASRCLSNKQKLPLPNPRINKLSVPQHTLWSPALYSNNGYIITPEKKQDYVESRDCAKKDLSPEQTQKSWKQVHVHIVRLF